MRTDIFQQWLAGQMKQTEISQTRLGDLLEIHPSYISQVLGGKRTPSYKFMENVAQKFQISFSEILAMTEDDLCDNVRSELVISQVARRGLIKGLLDSFIEYVEPDDMIASLDVLREHDLISGNINIVPGLVKEEVYRGLFLYYFNRLPVEVRNKEGLPEDLRYLSRINELQNKYAWVGDIKGSLCSLFLSILPGYLFLQVAKDLEADIDMFMYFHRYFHNLVNLYKYPRNYIVLMTNIDSSFKTEIAGKLPHPDTPFVHNYDERVKDAFCHFELSIDGGQVFGPDPKEVDQFDGVQVLDQSQKGTSGTDLADLNDVLDRKKPHWIRERVKGEGIIQVVLNLKQEDFLDNVDTIIRLSKLCTTI